MNFHSLSCCRWLHLHVVRCWRKSRCGGNCRRVVASLIPRDWTLIYSLVCAYISPRVWTGYTLILDSRYLASTHARRCVIVYRCPRTSGQLMQTDSMKVQDSCLRNLRPRYVTVDEETTVIDCIEVYRFSYLPSLHNLSLSATIVYAQSTGWSGHVSPSRHPLINDKLRSFAKEACLIVDVIQFESASNVLCITLVGTHSYVIQWRSKVSSKYEWWLLTHFILAVTFERTIIHNSGLMTSGRSTDHSGQKWEEKVVQGTYSPYMFAPISPFCIRPDFLYSRVCRQIQISRLAQEPPRWPVAEDYSDQSLSVTGVLN